MLDRVDEGAGWMGRVRTRVSAYAVAVDDGRVLLTRLSSASPVFEPGLWHLPGGGVDPGEQPVETLERELREETGLGLRSAGLLDVRTYAARRNGVDWQLVALFYSVRLAVGRPGVVERDGATAEVAWWEIGALEDAALSPPAADALRRVRR